MENMNNPWLNRQKLWHRERQSLWGKVIEDKALMLMLIQRLWDKQEEKNQPLVQELNAEGNVDTEPRKKATGTGP